jgi:hypothetical protein
MTEQQTAEARVIALFDDRKVTHLNDGGDCSVWYSDKGNFDPFQWQEQDLKYHTSWDWLMPVWQKFRAMPDDVDGKQLHYEIEIGHAILRDPTPSAAASLLSKAIIWIQSLKK